MHASRSHTRLACNRPANGCVPWVLCVLAPACGPELKLGEGRAADVNGLQVAAAAAGARAVRSCMTEETALTAAWGSEWVRRLTHRLDPNSATRGCSSMPAIVMSHMCYTNHTRYIGTGMCARMLSRAISLLCETFSHDLVCLSVCSTR